MRLAIQIAILFIWKASALAQSSEAGKDSAQEQSGLSTPHDSTLVKVAKIDSAKSTTTTDSCLAIVTVDSLDDGGVPAIAVSVIFWVVETAI